MLRNDITIMDLERLAILELRAEKYEKIGEQDEGEAYFEAYYRLSQELDGMTSAQAITLRERMIEFQEDGLIDMTGVKILHDGTLYAEADDYLVRTIHMIIQRDGESQTF